MATRDRRFLEYRRPNRSSRERRRLIRPRLFAYAREFDPPSGPTACSADVATGANAGTHATHCSGAVDPRYTFEYTAGTLTIEKAATSVGLTSTVGAGVKGQPLTFMAAIAVSVSFAGATVNTVNLQDAVLIGADFTGATVVQSNLSGTNLTNAVLKNASFTDTTFRNATFTGANLSGATFAGATLKDAIGLNTATLTGVVWTQTTCPNGSNSGSAGGTCVGRW